MRILCLTRTHSGALPHTAPLESLGHTVTELRATGHVAPPALVDMDAALILTSGPLGTDASREIRQSSNMPILVVSDQHDEVDTIAHLEVGADDVVAEPISSREIDARLRAIVRRLRPVVAMAAAGQCPLHPGPLAAVPSAAGPIIIGSSGLQIDPVQQRVTRGESVINLTATELRLLLALAERRGVPQSREVLLGLAWGHDYHGQSRIVDNSIHRLRAKIDTPEWKHIDNVRGYGYVLR